MSTAQSIQQLIDNSPVSRCICGCLFDTDTELGKHRTNCDILRLAIIGDVSRVAKLLQETPTIEQYNAYRHNALPSYSTIYNAGIFETWMEVISLTHLPQRRNGKVYNEAERVKDLLRSNGPMTLGEISMELYHVDNPRSRGPLRAALDKMNRVLARTNGPDGITYRLAEAQ